MYAELIAAREAALRRRASLLGAAYQAAWERVTRMATDFAREVEGVQRGRG